MSILIKGGTIVTAEQTISADILCENGTISAIGRDLDGTGRTDIIDASGCYVMPGGIDPHTHMGY